MTAGCDSHLVSKATMLASICCVMRGLVTVLTSRPGSASEGVGLFNAQHGTYSSYIIKTIEPTTYATKIIYIHNVAHFLKRLIINRFVASLGF